MRKVWLIILLLIPAMLGAADVIVMDYKPFTPFSADNIDGHMLFGMMGKNCRTTISSISMRA